MESIKLPPPPPTNHPPPPRNIEHAPLYLALPRDAANIKVLLSPERDSKLETEEPEFKQRTNPNKHVN